MPKPKQGLTKHGNPMHYSVGALIKKDGKYLLIDRAIEPYGFAGPAGHVDQGESEIEALVREVREETGLHVESHNLLFEEELEWNRCSKGIDAHHWYLYQCTVSGEIERNERETKSIGWYAPEQIKELKLEPVWQYWLKKLKVI